MELLGQTCASMAIPRSERSRTALGALEGAMVKLILRRVGDDTDVNTETSFPLALVLCIDWASFLTRIQVDLLARLPSWGG